MAAAGLFSPPASAQPVGKDARTDGAKLAAWAVGASVARRSAVEFGLERCFTQTEIPDSVFKRMRGRSYIDNPNIKRGDLRYLRLLYFDPKGAVRLGEMVCNKLIAADVARIFRQLFEAEYPIGRMELIDNYGADDERSMAANNTSCFCYRAVAGSRRLSAHARGMAVDINPLYNPYVKDLGGGRRKVRPKGGTPYINRGRKFVYKIDRGDLCYRLFTANGFRWGGAWRSCKDYQHFEKP